MNLSLQPALTNNLSASAGASANVSTASVGSTSAEESSPASFFSIYVSSLSDSSVSASRLSDSSSSHSGSPLSTALANNAVNRSLAKLASKFSLKLQPNIRPTTTGAAPAAAIPAASGSSGSTTEIQTLDETSFPPSPTQSQTNQNQPAATAAVSTEVSAGPIGARQLWHDGNDSDQNKFDFNRLDASASELSGSDPGGAGQNQGQSLVENSPADPAMAHDADPGTAPSPALAQLADPQLSTDPAAVLAGSATGAAAVMTGDSLVFSGMLSSQPGTQRTGEDSDSSASSESLFAVNAGTHASGFLNSISQPSIVQARRESPAAAGPRSVAADPSIKSLSTISLSTTDLFGRAHPTEPRELAVDALAFPRAVNTTDNVAAEFLRSGISGSGSHLHLSAPNAAAPSSSATSPPSGVNAGTGSGAKKNFDDQSMPSSTSTSASAVSGANSGSNALSQLSAHNDSTNIATPAVATPAAAPLSPQIVTATIPTATVPLATADNAGSATTAVPAAKTGEAATQPAAPTAPDAPNSAPAANSAPTVAPVQMAQMVSRASQSEMRIGMTTSAFGSVEVRTQVRANEVGLTIGSERGDLRMLLAPEIPGLANRLQQQSLRLSPVNFHDSSAFQGNSSAGGNSPRRFFPQPTPASAPVESAAETASSPATPESLNSRHAGLSVLA